MMARDHYRWDINSGRIVACLLMGLVLQPVLAFADPPTQDSTLRTKAAKPVRSIDPADSDDSDLKPVADSIGDASIVLLGEASHGDGATYLAKSRLVRYLHLKMGFDLLILESGFYDTLKANEALQRKSHWREAFGEHLSWTSVEQFIPTLNHVQASQETENPIAVGGLGWYSFSTSPLFDEVNAFLRAAGEDTSHDKQYEALNWAKKFLENLSRHRFPKKPTTPTELTVLANLIEKINADADGRFLRTHGPKQVGFITTSLECLHGHLAFYHRPPSTGGADDNPIGLQEHRNVQFLLNTYFPNRKAIIWAHSGHLMRGTKQVEDLGIPFKTNEGVALGQHLFDEYGQNLYSIMFTAYGGSTKNWRGHSAPLKAPPEGSLEHLLHKTGYRHAFLDFRALPKNDPLRDRLVARPIAHSNMRADWTQVFDGVFFVNEMAPTKKVNSGN